MKDVRYDIFLVKPGMKQVNLCKLFELTSLRVLCDMGMLRTAGTSL